MPDLRYAVVLKAHAWDGFIARQLQRYQRMTASGSVFLYLDETAGPLGDVPIANVVRATNDDLYAIGLSPRFERGSLIWWNTDYPHYLFHDRRPDFDYVLFCEYDTCCLGDIDQFVTAAASRGADLIALPTRTSKQNWMWTRFHVRTYDINEIVSSLNCISLYSARALRLLGQRRREMAAERVRFWPTNEVFIATEIARAGYTFLSLEEFGDANRYEWHPPILEEDLPSGLGMVFLHPVLDRKRYIASLLKFAPDSLAYFWPRSTLRRDLARFPAEEWQPQLASAAWKRACTKSRERIEGVAARLRNSLPRWQAAIGAPERQ